MKLFELTYDGERLTIHREAEERLTGEQKYSLIQTAIIAAAVCVVVAVVFSVFR